MAEDFPLPFFVVYSFGNYSVDLSQIRNFNADIYIWY